MRRTYFRTEIDIPKDIKYNEIKELAIKLETFASSIGLSMEINEVHNSNDGSDGHCPGGGYTYLKGKSIYFPNYEENKDG